MSALSQYIFQKRGDNAKKVVNFVKTKLEAIGYQPSLIVSSTVDNETISLETSRPLSQTEATAIQTIIQSYIPNESVVPVSVSSSSTIRVSQRTDVNVDFRTIEEAISFVLTEFTDETRQTTIVIGGGTYILPSTLVIPTGVSFVSTGNVTIVVPSIIINGKVSITEIGIRGTSLEPTITLATGSDVLLNLCTITHTSPASAGTLAISQMINSLSLATNTAIVGFTNGISTSGILQLTNVRLFMTNQTGITVNQFGQLYVSNMSIATATTGIVINTGISKLSLSQIAGCQVGILVRPAGTPTLTLSNVTFTGNAINDIDIQATKESNSTVIVNGCILDHNKLSNVNEIPVIWNSIGLTSAGYRHVFSGDVAIGITDSNTRLIVGQGEVLSRLYTVSVQPTLITLTSSVQYQALRVQFPGPLLPFTPTIQYHTTNNEWVEVPFMIIDTQTIQRQETGLLDATSKQDFYIMLGNIPLETWNHDLKIIAPNSISIPSTVIVTPVSNSIIVSENGVQLYIGSARPVRKEQLYHHSNSMWYIFKNPLMTPWLTSYVVNDDFDTSWPVVVKWKYVTKLPNVNIQWRLRLSNSTVFSPSASFTRQPLDISSSSIMTLTNTPRASLANEPITDEISAMIPTSNSTLFLELVPSLPFVGDILLLSVSVEYMAFRG